VTTVAIDGRSVSLTSLDRVLWPETGFTKGDLVEYYRRVAPVLLPHLAGRPLTLGRFPAGVDRAGFATTECRTRPDWMVVRRLALSSGRMRTYCVVDDLASLLWIANLGTVELHPFLACDDAAEEPSAVVFDLDPGPPAGVVECSRAALRLRDELVGLGLVACVKTSGSAGLHVFVPLNTPVSYAQTKAFARAVAERLTQAFPDELTSASAKGARSGRVLVDWLQNEPRRSTIAPYSLRAMPWPSVSTPVAWEEVERTASEEQAELLLFDATVVLGRIESLGDLFAENVTLEQRLPG
jgi:bifunctional non-homologous end joining protein LigD